MPVNTSHAIGQYARFVFRPQESLNELISGTAIGGSVGTTEDIGGTIAYVPAASDTTWTYTSNDLDPAVSGAFTYFWQGYLRDNVTHCLYATWNSGKNYGVQVGTYQYSPGWSMLYIYSQFQGSFKTSAPFVLTDNTLHTIAVRYDGSNAEFFLDGVSLGAPQAWIKDAVVLGSGQYFALAGLASKPNKTVTSQAFKGALSNGDITTLNSDPYAIFTAPPLTLTGGNATQNNTAGTGAIGIAGVLFALSCVQGNSASTGSITRDQTLTIGNTTQGNSASTGSIDPYSRLRNILRGTPINTWVKVNTNRFLDCKVPNSDDSPSNTQYTHERVVIPWSGFAFDRIHGKLLLWGGGHANYVGNEFYQWDGETGNWTYQSLPSRLDSESYVVDKAAPQSSHTYVNNIYLENQNFFCTFGGAAVPSGGPFRERTGSSPTTERRVGPWAFDMTLADGAKVGGTTGSGWDTVNVKTGGNMWLNRRDVVTGYPIDTLNHVDGGAVYANESGTDVAYVTMDNASGFPSFYKYTFGDLRSGGTDTCVKLGFTNGGVSYVNFAIYDSVRKWMFINGVGEVFNSSYPAEMVGLNVGTATGGTPTTPFRIRDELGNPIAMIRGTSGNYLHFGAAYDSLNDCIWMYSGHQTVDPNGVIYKVPLPAYNTGTKTWATTDLVAYRVTPSSGHIPRGGYQTPLLGKIKYVKELGALVVLDKIDSSATPQQDADVLLFKTTAFPSDLSIGTTTQDNSSSVGSISQEVTLSSSLEVTQGNDLTTGAIGQIHALAVLSAAQGNALSTGDITSGLLLVISDTLEANNLSVGTIAQAHALAIGNIDQSNNISNVAIIRNINLAVDALSQFNAVDNQEIILNSNIILGIANLAQVNGLLASSISVDIAIVAANLQQSQTLTIAAISQIHNLIIGEVSQQNIFIGGGIVLPGLLFVDPRYVAYLRAKKYTSYSSGIKMFDIKDPNEEITLTFDFSARSGAISNALFEVRLIKGVDVNPGAIISNSTPTISGSKVLIRVTGGKPNCWYLIRCFAYINGDKILLEDILPIQGICLGI